MAASRVFVDRSSLHRSDCKKLYRPRARRNPATALCDSDTKMSASLPAPAPAPLGGLLRVLTLSGLAYRHLRSVHAHTGFCRPLWQLILPPRGSRSLYK